MPPFSPSDRVIILGAGATAGASFTNNTTVRPPLNADFFTQLQRMVGKHASTARDVIRDVVQLFGPNFSLTLEDYFSQLESMIDASRLTSKGVGSFTASQLRQRRDRLMKALAAVLEASTDDAIRSRAGCSHHDKLVAILAARDTVISFNYDCVIDDALRRSGNEKWSARYGYAFKKPARIRDDGVAHWDPDVPGSAAANTVYLLKLHGSINWKLPADPDGEIVLKQRLHQQRGTPQFTIVPPSWNKQQQDHPIFDDLWKKAERSVRNARTVVIAGFSFTPTDLHVEAVVRLALARSNSLKTLVIANPSRGDRERIRAVFSRALNNQRAVVRQYEDFEQFVGALPDALS
jgi:hypothetical protein